MNGGKGLFLLLWAVTLLTCGCGSDSSTSVASAPSGILPDRSYEGFVLGRVMLERPMPEGQVRILDRQGNSVREVATDKLGFFRFRGRLPEDFSVVARPRDSQDEYRLEVRGGWKGGTLYVNCATTLAAAYAAAHPDLTYPVAAGRVHRFLRLQDNYRLAWVSTVRTRRYDPRTFYDGVRRVGQVAYVESVVEAIDGPPRLLLVSDIVAGLAEAVGSTLLTDVINASAGSAIGSALNSMNMNFGTSAELDEIMDELGDISNELSSLGTTIGQDNAYDEIIAAQQSLTNAVTNISLQTQTINSNAVNYLATHPSDSDYNKPQVTPANVTSAVNSLLTFGLEFNLTTILNGTVGGGATPSILLLLAQEQMSLLGIDNDKAYYSYPVRTNANTDAQSRVAAYYLNILAQGLNLVAEYAHLQAPAALPLADAVTEINQVQGQMQQLLWQVPDPLPSDEVLVDLEAGTMWLLAFQAPSDYQTALDTAAQLEIGPYDDWSLACEERLENFITNRVLGLAGLTGSSWGNVDASVWIAAFATLGFDTTYYPTSKGQGTFFDQDTNIDFGNTNFYEWNGSTESNPSTFELSTLFGSDEASFLIYRAYPGEPEVSLRTTAADPTVQFIDELDNAVGVVDAQGNELYTSPLATGALFSGNLVLTNGAPTTVADPGTQPLVPANPNQLRALQAFKIDVVQSSDCPNPYADQPYFAENTYFDVTPRCQFSSSNPAVASVSNAAPVGSPSPSPGSAPVAPTFPSPNPNAPPPGPVGRITWHPSLSGSPLPAVTFTATLGGLSDPQTFTTNSGSLTLNPPAGLQPVMTSLQILPVNQAYDLVNANSTQVVNCTATAFYADGQFVDVSSDPKLTWLAFDANGYLLDQPSVGGFNQTTGVAGQLLLTSNITTSVVTVAAIYEGPWGSQITTAKLGLDLTLQPSPSPTPTPAVTELNIFPKNPVYTGLPAQASFLTMARLSNGQQRIYTPNLQWNLVSNTGVIGIPVTQGSISVGNITAVARLTSQYQAPFVTVSSYDPTSDRTAFTSWTKK